MMKTFALSLFAAVPVFAQQPAPVPAPRSVKLTLDLGLVNASGNTSVTTFNTGDNFELKRSAFALTQFAAIVYGRSGDSTNAEQIKAGTRLDRQLVSMLHGFVGVTYERNRFAGIARRFEEFAGLGLRVVDSPSDVWTVETGVSLNQKRSTASVNEKFVALRFATLYRHNFTKAAYASQNVEILPSVQSAGGVLMNTESSLVAPVAGRMALKLSYTVKYDSEPEPGFRKTDRVFASGLQIMF